MRRAIVSIVSVVLLASGVAWGAPTPEQKCHGGKNEAAGKLSACLAKAEKKLVASGDAAAYGDAVAKCSDKFQSKWQKLEDKAVAAGTACPTTMDQTDIQGFVTACNDAVADALDGSSLLLDPFACDASLSTCYTSLGTCNADYSSCSTSLATCNAGTATTGDVLAGKTFSSSAGLGLTGTAAAGGNVSGADGSLSFTIPDACYFGSKTCSATDSDLSAGNIALGVNIFGVSGTALPAQLLKTAQTTCYNLTGTVIPCAGSGQDGEWQKGLARAYTDNGDGTITDNRTGLIWEKLDDNNANGIHDRDRSSGWANAIKKVQVLNGNVAGCIAANNPDTCCTGPGTGSCSAFAGQTDWRLPNQFELISLVDFGRSGPAVDPLFNSSCTPGCTVAGCSCTRSFSHWSATSYQGSGSFAWAVNFNDGDIIAGDKTTSFYTRAVRGGS